MTDFRATPSSTLSQAVALVGPYELYMLVLSVFALTILAADTLLSLDASAHEVFAFTDTSLCVLFFADFVRSLRRAPRRMRYMLTAGWLDVISSIPAVGVLRLGRISRVARILRLLRAVRSVRTIGLIISRHRKESAILAATVVTVMLTVFASLAVLQFERHPDSNITTGGDALWWAFATITTVGYGDRFPVTLEGRLVAAMLMAAGVALFGTLSGLVASWFLHGDHAPADEESAQIAELSEQVSELRNLLLEREGRARAG